MESSSSQPAKAHDPLASLLTDLVRQNRGCEAIALLSSDAARLSAHFGDVLNSAVRWKRPTVISALLRLAAIDVAVPRQVVDSLAAMADDASFRSYEVLTRLNGGTLGSLYCGCVVAGQEALALRLLPHLRWDDSDVGTALVPAAERGCLRLLAALLDRQAAAADAEDAGGRTALAAACSAGMTGAVRLLLERGADPARENRDGTTCLTWLASEGGEVASLLATAECLGSSQAMRQRSLELHSLLRRCGFTARQAELHCEAADFLLRRVAQRMTPRGGACRLGGSFSEGWGACLLQADGRLDADSDVNWLLSGCDAEPHEQPSGGILAGTPTVSVDWELGRRPSTPTEAARIAQLLRNGSDDCNVVRKTTNLPACFADQEMSFMRCLSTIQGQLFVVIKIIFKKLLPSFGLAALTSYHAKTVLFFMVARHSQRRSWWQPETLLSLVLKALDLTIELLDMDTRPCVCMPHFFAEGCQLAFRDPTEGTKARVRESLALLRTESARIEDFLRNLLRPMQPPRSGVRPLVFHPYTLLPREIGTKPVIGKPQLENEFADAYRLVLGCLIESVAQVSSPADKAGRLARLSALPPWCHCARLCLTVMTHLCSGERLRAVELLMSQSKHQVQRYWDMERCFFLGGLQAGRAGGTDAASCGDWGWRFCFSGNLPAKCHHLPTFTRSLLQPRSDSPNQLYLNFRSIEWSLRAELLPKNMVHPANWFAEMKIDPDYPELLTLVQYSENLHHLQFCYGALNQLHTSWRVDLSADIEAVRTKLAHLVDRSSDGDKIVLRRSPARRRIANAVLISN